MGCVTKKDLFRVKPYAHSKYKFVVRAKLEGKWRRSYFRNEKEAMAYARDQNAASEKREQINYGRNDRSNLGPGGPGVKNSTRAPSKRLAAARQAVVILGMHRSGTSALGGALQLLGVNFGQRLAPPGRDNEKGYWEHPEIVALHDELLRSLGSHWDDDKPLPSDWVKRKITRNVRSLLVGILERDFADSALFGMKDPRMCRLMPLWFPIFQTLGAEPHFVLMVRHPWDVAESLAKRNGIEHPKSYLLWLEHVVQAETATRSHQRSFVRYDEMVDDPAAILGQLRKQLGVNLRTPSRVRTRLRNFLDPSMRHHQFNKKTADKLREPVPQLALDFYETIRNASTSREIAGKMEPLVAQFISARELFYPRIDLVEAPLASLINKIAKSEETRHLLDTCNTPAQLSVQLLELNRVRDEKERQVLHLQEEFEEKVKHVALLQGELKEKSEHVVLLQGELKGRSEQVVHFQREFEEKAKHVALLQGELKGRSEQVVRFQHEFEEKAKHVALLQGELKGRSEQVVRFQHEFEEKVKHVALLQGELKEKSEHVVLLQGELKGRSEQVVRFQHEFEEKVKHVALLQSELKEKSEQVIHFQHEFEEKSQRAAQFKTEAEERSRNVTQLQRDLEEKSWQAAQLQRESDQQSELVEQLKDQLLTENDRVRRASEKLLDARWEALTLRGTLLRRTESAGSPFSRILELETRVEAATSERDQLRKMLTSLQKNLELEQMTGQSKQDEFRATQAQLKATIKDLRSAHKQMDRLRENISRKLILPFGRSQRKFQQLISDRRADD